MEGYIVVQVSTADQAIPIENATVMISRSTENGEELVRILRTNRNGKTEIIGVPAPPEANSLTPDGGVGFSNYNIRVDYPGYYSTRNLNVPVFPGQTSIQSVPMIPLSEGAEQGTTITSVEEEPFGNNQERK